MGEFSAMTMAKLIKKAAKVRVSRSAALELGAILEERALEISSEAIKLAQHRGAKTVTEKDVRMATKEGLK